MDRVFRTDRLTFLSYGLLVVAYALFIAFLVHRAGGVNFSAFILAVLVLPVFGYFFFLVKKRVRVTEQGIEVFGLTGRKEIRWQDVVSVSLVPGRKYFLFVESKDGTLAVVDDSFEEFPEIVRLVGEKAPKGSLSENYWEVAKGFRRSYLSPAILIVAAVVLIGIVVKSALQ
ncbi:PH domain-containing protein [Thermovibrio ammonificans]|uniref:Low molecular weight protein antigen 6 PH domain-containing protein n=1 Tax=Thermovibrio ammonificans (strain DSM 15698 / JCM 12110 / HB-1) TaxID=648996 RepID=E8T663_THEA1|nr:PH domain-containing protein [Thermovibrio ammonificans]ADU96647.1 hypothetical protein Theam_0679 [Thermovibrio ammonificans HB-1]